MEGNGASGPAKPRWSRRRRVMIALAIILGISVPLFSVLALDYSVCPTVVMVPGGSTLSVRPTRHLDYNFTVTKVVIGPNRPVQAVFSSDNPVVMYIMTIYQYKGFNSSGIASSYVWTSGPVTFARYVSCGTTGEPLCSDFPEAPIGSYYLVLYNPSQTVTATVTVSQNVQLGSC